MTAQTFAYGFMVVLLLLAAFCFRMSAWHRHEAGFWREISLLDRMGMAPKDAPDLLRWVKAHRPGVVERLRGWKSPHVRRARSQDSASYASVTEISGNAHPSAEGTQ